MTHARLRRQMDDAVDLGMLLDERRHGAALDRPPSDNGKEPPYRLYNLGNQRSEELKRFIAVLEQAIGRNAVIEFAPLQPGDVPATYADITETTHDLGFLPKTRIDEGVPRFVEWYRRYHRV